MISKPKGQDNASESAIKHGYAKVNGLQLHYAECGSGADLVILLHGFPEFWYSWRHQLAFLGKRCHVVAPDMRGYNLSDKPSRVGDYQIDVLVKDVIDLIGHFRQSKATIVGHDWGAGVAWAVAQRRPEYVSRLAVMQVPLASAWRANLTLKQLRRSWYMFFFQLPRLPEWWIRRNDFAAIAYVFKEKVIRKGSFSHRDIELYKEALRQPGALTGAINYYRANVLRLMRRPNSGGKVRRVAEQEKHNGRLRVPTLFIFGEQDFAIIPETVRCIEEYIDAPYREVRIPDSGHWVQNEAVNEVNNALMEFLDSQ